MSRLSFSSRVLSARSLRHAAAAACEVMECRRLLAVDLQWANRGASDNFAAIYGANAGVARNAVDRAMEDWEKVIQDFNRSVFSNNVYTLNISAGPISGRGVTNITGTDIFSGKPTSSDITLDDNGGGATNGWYFDTFIGTDGIEDDGEFDLPITPFTAGGGPSGTADFYRTAAHEIGHAMGIYNGGLVASFATDAGDDPNSSDPADRLLGINTNGVAGAEYTLTEDGGGHLFEGGGTYSGPVHPNSLLNSGRTYVEGRRQLIGNAEASILRDALGYDVTLPSTFHSFYVGLNRTTNTVTVYGDINQSGSDVDVIDIELEPNGDLRVESQGGAFVEIIPNAEYTTLIINSGNGNDDIDVDFIATGKTVTVNAGNDNDLIDVAIEGDDLDTNIDSNVTINGGSGTDTINLYDSADGLNSDSYTISSTQVIKSPAGSNRQFTYGTTERVNVVGSNQASTYNVTSLLSTVSLDINAGTANDTLNVGSGNDLDLIDGSINFAGGSGSDVANINDSADLGGIRNYQWAGAALTRENIGSIFINTGTEDVNVFGSNASNNFTVPQVSPFYTNLSFTGGTGNDSFTVGNFGDIAANVLSVLSIIGGTGSDDVTWTDNAAAAGSYTVTSTSAYKGSILDPRMIYSGVEALVVNTGNGDDTVSVTSTNAAVRTSLNTRNGVDLINVVGGVLTLRSGAGLDTLEINDDELGTADVTLIGNEDFQAVRLYVGSSLTVSTNGSTVLDTVSLGTVRGILNLNDNFVVVRSPTESFLVDKLARGFNAGGWNGLPAGGAAGVIRSNTAAVSAKSDGVGYARIGAANNQLNLAVYRGVAVAVGDMILSYTLNGDTNLDKTVNFDDLLKIAQNYNLAGNWVGGNFDYDATVEFDDLLFTAQNYNTSVFASDFASARNALFSKKRILLDSATEAQLV